MNEALVVEGHIQFIGRRGTDAGNWKPKDGLLLLPLSRKPMLS